MYEKQSLPDKNDLCKLLLAMTSLHACMHAVLKRGGSSLASKTCTKAKQQTADGECNAV